MQIGNDQRRLVRHIERSGEVERAGDAAERDLGRGGTR
jgi:hypothetical protein